MAGPSAPSSTSNTPMAESGTRSLPRWSVCTRSAVAIPFSRFEPSGLVITASPARRAASAMIRVVVVLPPRPSRLDTVRSVLPVPTATARVAARVALPANSCMSSGRRAGGTGPFAGPARSATGLLREQRDPVGPDDHVDHVALALEREFLDPGREFRAGRVRPDVQRDLLVVVVGHAQHPHALATQPGHDLAQLQVLLPHVL